MTPPVTPRTPPAIPPARPASIFLSPVVGSFRLSRGRRAEGSGALGAGALAAAADRAELDAVEGRGVEVGAGGASDLAGGDAGDPLGPAQRLVEAQVPALE